MPYLRTLTILKTLIIATVLLPTLAIAQRSQQLPQPRQPGQWCPVGWMASGSYCVPGSDKAPFAIPKNGWCPAGWRDDLQLEDRSRALRRNACHDRRQRGPAARAARAVRAILARGGLVAVSNR